MMHQDFVAAVQVGLGRFLAEAPAAVTGTAPGGPAVADKSSPTAFFMAMLPFLLIFGIFYFLVIGPQRKQQKEMDAMLAALRKGDRVVTNGGLHGVITEFKEADKAVMVEIAQNVRVVVSRSAIATVKREATPPAK